MGKSSAPPPPDYAAAATAQGDANKDTALYNSNINRVDQYSPQGSSTWQLKPGADPKNPQPGDYVQTTSLNPQLTAQYNQGNQITGDLLNTASTGLGRIDQSMASPFSTAGLPGQVTGVQGGPMTTGVDTSSLPELANGGSYAPQVKAVQDAMYSRLGAQNSVNREQQENKLLNSGIEKGTQGWNDAQRVLGQNDNDAASQAVLAGSQEQSRLAGLDSSARAQLYGEGLSNANLNNSTQNTQFQQGLSNAGLANQGRSTGIQEEAYLRSLPLNELNALRTGGQVSMPSFSGYYSGGQAGAAPTYQATQDTYNAGLASSNASNAASGQLYGTLGTLGAAGIGAYGAASGAAALAPLLAAAL